MDLLYVLLGGWIGAAVIITAIIFFIDAIIPGRNMSFSTRIKVILGAIAWPLIVAFFLLTRLFPFLIGFWYFLGRLIRYWWYFGKRDY